MIILYTSFASKDSRSRLDRVELYKTDGFFVIKSITKEELHSDFLVPDCEPIPNIIRSCDERVK